MTMVLPNTILPAAKNARDSAVVLTVWKKSLICNGFTVYDSRGILVYRVDNYAAGSIGEIVLMDAVGKPLLTGRRKRLSLGDCWMVYNGEKTVDPRFMVRRHVNLRNSKALAQVISGTSGTASYSSSPPWARKNVMYEIEGSYAQRSVSVYDKARRRVAEIRPKETGYAVALGADVFSLITVGSSHMETTVAMALVILLEQMFGSHFPSSGGRLSQS